MIHMEQIVKPCSRCRINLPEEDQRYCKPCRADYMRAWRLSRRSIPVPPNVKQGDVITYEVGRRGRMILVSVAHP